MAHQPSSLGRFPDVIMSSILDGLSVEDLLLSYWRCSWSSRHSCMRHWQSTRSLTLVAPSSRRDDGTPLFHPRTSIFHRLHAAVLLLTQSRDRVNCKATSSSHEPLPTANVVPTNLTSLRLWPMGSHDDEWLSFCSMDAFSSSSPASLLGNSSSSYGGSDTDASRRDITHDSARWSQFHGWKDPIWHDSFARLVYTNRNTLTHLPLPSAFAAIRNAIASNTIEAEVTMPTLSQCTQLQTAWLAPNGIAGFHAKQVLLPSITRVYVRRPDLIALLFSSLAKGSVAPNVRDLTIATYERTGVEMIRDTFSEDSADHDHWIAKLQRFCLCIVENDEWKTASDAPITWTMPSVTDLSLLVERDQYTQPIAWPWIIAPSLRIYRGCLNGNRLLLLLRGSPLLEEVWNNETDGDSMLKYPHTLLPSEQPLVDVFNKNTYGRHLRVWSYPAFELSYACWRPLIRNAASAASDTKGATKASAGTGFRHLDMRIRDEDDASTEAVLRECAIHAPSLQYLKVTTKSILSSALEEYSDAPSPTTAMTTTPGFLFHLPQLRVLNVKALDDSLANRLRLPLLTSLTVNDMAGDMGPFIASLPLLEHVRLESDISCTVPRSLQTPEATPGVSDAAASITSASSSPLPSPISRIPSPPISVAPPLLIMRHLTDMHLIHPGGKLADTSGNWLFTQVQRLSLQLGDQCPLFLARLSSWSPHLHRLHTVAIDGYEWDQRHVAATVVNVLLRTLQRLPALRCVVIQHMESTVVGHLQSKLVNNTRGQSILIHEYDPTK